MADRDRFVKRLSVRLEVTLCYQNYRRSKFKTHVLHVNPLSKLSVDTKGFDPKTLASRVSLGKRLRQNDLVGKQKQGDLEILH